MAYNDTRKQKRKRRADRRVDVNRLGGQRPAGPATQPSIARPGAFAGQPNIRLEGGGLGGQARMPDSLPAKTSTGPRMPTTAEISQYASFPAPAGAALFPNEGPLKNAPASQTSAKALDDSRAKDMFLKSGLRLAGEGSLRSGLSPKEDLSPQMRETLRGMGVGQGTDEKGLPSNSILGQPQPTLGYYFGQIAPESAAGSGTVIAPGQDQNVMDSRISKNLLAFNPQSLIVKSEAELGIEESKKREQAARDEIAAINAEREKLNPMFDSSDPFNMANAAGPRMPTTAEGDLARRSRQAAAGIGDPLSAAEQSQLSEFRAKSYAAANGLPYIPTSAPRTPQTSRRSLPDIKAGELETNGEGLQVRSTVNRVTTPDGRQVTFGQGNGQGSRMAVENGNIMMTDTDGTRRAVVLPSSGYSLGLRTAEVDSQGNFIPGTFRTQSDQARREERQDLAIARGNAPDATPEEKVAGQQAQSAKEKFAAYKERMKARDEKSGPLLQRTAQVQAMYPGVSRAAAAGMAQTEMMAQERMQQQMKQQQDNEMAKRRQDMLLEAYKANPNDPRLQDAFAKDLGLRGRTPEEQSRYDRDQFNLKINEMTQNNELTMDPRQIPSAGVGDLDDETRSKLLAGIDDALKSDLLTDEDRMQLFRNVDLDVMKELIDGTAFDKQYFDEEKREKPYKDFEAYLKRTGQLEEEEGKPTKPFKRPYMPKPINPVIMF